MGMSMSAGVVLVDRQELGRVRASLGGVAATVFELDTGGRVDREAFFAGVRRSLPLDPPLTSSRSWDALSDSLWEGLSLVDDSRIVIVWDTSVPVDDHASADFTLALSVLTDVVEMLVSPDVVGSGEKTVRVYVARPVGW